MGNEQSSRTSSLVVARLRGHTFACNMTIFIASQDMAEILFGTDFLHSLQASDEPRH